ncbi:MAG TPA: PaaI family thioesterase [Candidatus Sulfotelmatobacter sp.]|nr:PaaI family thioesterase [Candidatus Sulfotelmatobacter sp.]
MTSEARGQVFRVEVAPHGCFVCGDLNDQGLHVALRVGGGRAWTELTLTARHEGWAGVIHGGILAALLDEVMGWALFQQDCWGVTADLGVRYKAPVRVGQRVRVEGWVTETHRRVFRARGQVLDAMTGDLLCTGEATYVAAPAAQKADLQARYQLRLVPLDRDDLALLPVGVS